MSIIVPLGRSVQQYLRLYGQEGPDLPIACGHCQCRMHRHGRYPRSAATSRRLHRIPIYRWRCPTCGKTCSVLPAFLRPYARFTTWVRERVVRQRLGRGLPWAALVRRASCLATSLLSHKTLRRWVHQALAAAPAWAGFLARYILESWPAVDVYGLSPRREGAAAPFWFALDLAAWLRAQVAVGPDEPYGLFAFLNQLEGSPRSL